LRDDEVERYGDPDELLKNSPLEKKAYQVLVKKILNK
jgi:Asp-tRNA(Asn)/Glu-tRNA(Gln) amidotransferase C subunit